MLGCSLFGVKLTKNANPDGYSYSRYGIGFDARGSGFGKNEIIFGADMSPFVHIEIRRKMS